MISKYAAAALICDCLCLVDRLRHRQVLKPPVHHPIAFGKEPVTTDVHAVSLVVDSAGNSTHVAALFEHDWLDVGTGQQLVGGGQARGSGADNDCSSRHCWGKK